jgi:hypothetical protein
MTTNVRRLIIWRYLDKPITNITRLSPQEGVGLRHRSAFWPSTGAVEVSPKPLGVASGSLEQDFQYRPLMRLKAVPLKQRHEVFVHRPLAAVVERLNRRLLPPRSTALYAATDGFLIAFSASANNRSTSAWTACQFFCAAFSPTYRGTS